MEVPRGQHWSEYLWTAVTALLNLLVWAFILTVLILLLGWPLGWWA